MVALVGVFFLIGVSGIPASSHDGGTQPGDGLGDAVFRLLAAGFAFICLVVMYCIARQGIWADRNGVMVRNPTSTHRIPWDDIEGFGRPSRYGARRNAGLKVLVRHGPPVNAALYGKGPRTSPDVANATIDALEELRCRYSSGGRTDSSDPPR